MPAKYGYMCGVTWEHEVGHAPHIRVYPTLRALRASFTSPKHEKECGYVKVKLVQVARKRGTVA